MRTRPSPSFYTKCAAALIVLFGPGHLIAQISTTCVPAVSIAISAFNGSICIGQSAGYTVTGAVGYTFTTNPPTASPFTSPIGVVSPTSHTGYQVTGTNQFGCISYSEHVLFVNPLPAVSITASPTLFVRGFLRP